jgi:hypothetical protein
MPNDVNEILGSDKSQGIAFLVASGTVVGIVAAACSSPQTAELNADKRSATLMKWVHIGMVNTILMIGLAAVIDPKHRVGILAGGGLQMAIMYGSYVHAKQAGLSSTQPGTESW